MKYLGVALYILWLLLTMLRFNTLPKDRDFSYQDAIFGRILWYHNIRTLLLVTSLIIIVFYVPLKIIYLLALISSILFGISCFKNFFNRTGNAWIDLRLFFLACLIAILSGIFIIKL